MNKHTPGPWKYHLGRGANPRFHIQTIGGYQIASTPELTTPRTAKLATDFDENQEREANARLIATATELLAALSYTNLDTDHEGCFCNCPIADGTRPDTHHATSCVEARAALSKVRGE